MLSNLWEISYQQKLPTTSSAGFTCWTEPDPIWETGSLGAQKVEIYEKLCKMERARLTRHIPTLGFRRFRRNELSQNENGGYFNIQSYFCSQKLENEDFKMSMHCILYMFGWFAAANSAPKNQTELPSTQSEMYRTSAKTIRWDRRWPAVGCRVGEM